MIRLENVCKNFGDLQVLKNVNLEVKEGEKLVIIGPSGSGKSTTVRRRMHEFPGGAYQWSCLYRWTEADACE